MNNNRIYYGEYSLESWIRLMLKKNVELPEYQRTFVWGKEDYDGLIESFKNKQFIPPVTIGAYKKNGEQINLIIDGQQRLTSVLLAYLERFPKKENGKKVKVSLADENDDSGEDDEDEMIEWTFKELLEKGKKKEDIVAKCSSQNYDVLTPLDEDFFKKNYLGFSYIVPDAADESEQQRFFSTLFRNINIQGKSLSAIESRESLYFLNGQYKEWFEPDFAKGIVVGGVSQKKRMDFVRYVSLLSQYKQDYKVSQLAYGYTSRMEKYYETYIYSVVGSERSAMFGLFTDVFPDKNYKPQLEKLKEYISKLDYQRVYTSIIELDIFFFGLLYFVLFEKKELDISQKENIKEELKKIVEDIKSEPKHTKSPAKLKYLSERVAKSIKTYEPFFS